MTLCFAEHRYPFSLFSESKESKECKTEKLGHVVVDTMDKTIGRAGNNSTKRWRVVFCVQFMELCTRSPVSPVLGW